MSASQQTTNYDFPKFAGADKPAWLVDFNGAMDAIDSTIKTVADLLATLQGTVDANTDDIAQLITDLTTAQGILSTLQGIVSQNVLDISANGIAITGLESDKANIENAEFIGDQPIHNGEVMIENSDQSSTNINKVAGVTEAEYTALTKDPNTLYVVV